MGTLRLGAGTPRPMAELELRVIAPERVVLETRVESLQALGLDGWVGVLPRHAPMLLALDVGLLRFVEEGVRRSIFVSGGFLEVRDDRVRVVTEASELAAEIDVERAEAAAERARERIRQARDGRAPDVDLTRAESALQRAFWRLRAHGELGG